MSRKFSSDSSFGKQRRKILRLLGLSGAAVVSHPAISQIRVIERADRNKILTVTNNERYLTVKLLRPEDLLSLELRYYNFSLSGKQLQKKGSPAYLVVIFQPQSISEQAWNEEATGLETPTVPGKLMIGAESRLVFSIPDTITTIPLDINDLLAWEKYNLVVNDRAKQPAIIHKLRNPVLTPRVSNMRSKISATGINKKAQSVKGLTKDERITVNTMLFPEENSRREVITNMPANMMRLAVDPVGPVAELETSIETPLRFYLSPTQNSGWKHYEKIKQK